MSSEAPSQYFTTLKIVGAMPTLVVGMFLDFGMHAHDKRGHGTR